jgi:hypothetical protein
MKDREKWMQLCEQASREQDPKKMIALTAEIVVSCECLIVNSQVPGGKRRQHSVDGIGPIIYSKPTIRYVSIIAF